MRASDSAGLPPNVGGRLERLRALAEGIEVDDDVATYTLRRSILRRAKGTLLMIEQLPAPSNRWERRIHNRLAIWYLSAAKEFVVQLEYIENVDAYGAPIGLGWLAWADRQIDVASLEIGLAAAVGLRDRTLTAAYVLTEFLTRELYAYSKVYEAASRARPGGRLCKSPARGTRVNQ